MPFQLKTPLFLVHFLLTIYTEGVKTVSNLKNLKYLNLYKTNMENKEIAAINFSKEMQVISPTPKDTALIASDSVLISAIKK
jgi:hypothetical protein